MGRPNKGKGKISRAELDKRLEECYDSLYERALALCVEHDTQIVASTMLAQALRLYKTSQCSQKKTSQHDGGLCGRHSRSYKIQPYRASKLHLR
jgi:hypothetical protein